MKTKLRIQFVKKRILDSRIRDDKQKYISLGLCIRFKGFIIT